MHVFLYKIKKKIERKSKFILNSNPYPKAKTFFGILNYLTWSLQGICKIPKPRSKPLVFWVHLSELGCLLND